MEFDQFYYTIIKEQLMTKTAITMQKKLKVATAMHK